jgi:transcriptional regulator with XRE-family HTH domain
MKPFERIENPREIRRRLGLNQQEFWSRIGVTQSGGSRYESGRTMPKPVRELLRLVHVEKVDLGRVRGDDIEIIAHLKERNPGLYKDLKKAIRGRNKRN